MKIIGNLDSRSTMLLKRVIDSDIYVSINNLTQEFNVSKRTVYYDFCKINDFLSLNNLPLLIIERSKGMFVNENDRDTINKALTSALFSCKLLYSPFERFKIIVLYLIHFENDKVSLEDIQNFLHISRNTALSDIRTADNKIYKYDLCIKQNNKLGYYVEGSLIKKRAVYFHYFSILMKHYNNGNLILGNVDEINEYYLNLKKIEKKLDMQYVEGTITCLASLIPVMRNTIDHSELDHLNNEELCNSIAFEEVNRYFGDLSQCEKYYLTLHLLSSRYQFSFANIDNDNMNYNLARDLVSEFERIACVSFKNREQLQTSLFYHLKSSMYRYKYGIQIGNPLLDEVRNNYNDIFKITKRVSDYLRQLVQSPISDDEIAYLTMHFGGFLRLEKNNKLLKILVVCANGLATGELLKAEILSMCKNVEIVDVVSSKQFDYLKPLCDLIISTVSIKTSTPNIVVHPILTNEDRYMIIKKCNVSNYYVGNQNLSYDQIMSVVSKYVDQGVLEVISKELKNITGGDYVGFKNNETKITDLLDNSKINFFNGNYDFSEAIYSTSKPLLENNSISLSYCNAMINNVNKYGPYNVIVDEVVLAHASYLDGVNNLDIAIGFFEKGIRLSQDCNISVIIVLAIVDNDSHLGILKDILTFFNIYTKVDELINSRNSEDVLNLFRKELCI